jgi:LmbE family N-acetylglucosaminyl deacetylase
MQPHSFEPLQPKVVLGIAAHPDDLDFGAAGTMAKYAAAGAQVHYLLLTDGSKGSSDHAITTTDLIKRRQAEQRAACTLIGGTDVHFLDYPDGGLEPNMDVKQDVVRVIRTLKPDVVIAWDPSVYYVAEMGFINHPDHRAAGQVALDAVYPLARDHLSFPEVYAEGLEPHKVSTILLMNLAKNNFVVDISNTINTKMAAIAAHPSQLSDVELTKQRFMRLASEFGAPYGYRYAEPFIRIDIPA